MLDDLKWGGKQTHHTVSTEKNTAKILKYYFGEGAGNFFLRIFAFSEGFWNPTAAKSGR